MATIRAGSAADAAQIAAVQREGWFAAYEGIIPAEIIDTATAPDNGARVRQAFRTRPWQRMLVAVAADQEGPESAAPGIVGYASFGPETDFTAPWPPPRTTDGEEGRVAELYALYVRPAWWSTGTGRALVERVLSRTSDAGYLSITLLDQLLYRPVPELMKAISWPSRRRRGTLEEGRTIEGIVS